MGKGKHWLYVQSWAKFPPLAFTDNELAKYLNKAIVGSDKHPKRIRPIVVTAAAKRIFRAPMVDLKKNSIDVTVYRYWKCIMQKKVTKY